MDRQTAERTVEQDLRRSIESMIPGARCVKFVSPGWTGVPDRMILLPGGAVVFAELKRPGETPRPRQVYVHRILRQLGFVVFGCVDSKEAVRDVVQACMLISGQARVQKSRRRIPEEAADTQDEGYTERAADDGAGV